MKKTRGFLALIVAGSLVVLCAAAATAWVLLRDDERSTRGSCDNATYRLTNESDSGGSEVSFELQSSAPDETWNVRIDQRGTTLLEGERITDEDAEIDLDTYARAGSDHDSFTAVATNAAGDTCTATLRP